MLSNALIHSNIDRDIVLTTAQLDWQCQIFVANCILRRMNFQIARIGLVQLPAFLISQQFFNFSLDLCKLDLMGGQFASNELVTIVGLKLRAIENVRILGPVRKASQVEISATDAVKLGIKAPVRESGDIKGSAPIAVVGPCGVLYLKEGCIIAKRHIHMSPADAERANVKNGDIVSVKVDNERATTFNNVTIRVDPSFTLEMHIDTDEANAARISTGMKATIVGK